MNLVEFAAEHAYAGARIWCSAFGHPVLPSWEDATEDARASVRSGVEGVLAGNTPRDSHAGWMRIRLQNGWTYGPVKDVEAKKHPNLVPYDELPPDQRAKDILFVNTVRAAVLAFESLETP